jgi:hypothetical protein
VAQERRIEKQQKWFCASLFPFAFFSSQAVAETPPEPSPHSIYAEITNAIIFSGKLPIAVRVEWEMEDIYLLYLGGLGWKFGETYLSAGGGVQGYFIGNTRHGIALDIEVQAGFWGEDPMATLAPGFAARWTFDGGSEENSGVILGLRCAAYLWYTPKDTVPLLPYINLGLGWAF